MCGFEFANERPALVNHEQRQHGGDARTGEAMAHVLATFAQFERRLIADRTRAALAVKKAQGVRLGQPASIPDKLAKRIVRMRER